MSTTMQPNGNRESPLLPGELADHEQADPILCPQCGSASSAGRKFCSRCGTGLWDACFGCGESVSSSEKFCGACGVNLTAGLDERVAQVERNLLEARRLELECQYEQAIALLEPITRMSHSRLADHARQARERAARLRASWKEGRATAEAALEEARTRMASSDYEAAARILQEVPPPLRTEAVETDLAAANEKVEEIALLSDWLRDAVASKQTNRLLETVNRLLELQPNHARALHIAQQLRNRLYRTAAERLARYQCDEAVGLLDRIPPAAETPEVVKLREQAVEQAWLNWDLRTAPFVDKALLSAAARLRKRALDDPKLSKLLEQLERSEERRGGEECRSRVPPYP